MAGPQVVEGRASQCIQKSVEIAQHILHGFRRVDVERGSSLQSSARTPWTKPLLKNRAVGKRIGKIDK